MKNQNIIFTKLIFYFRISSVWLVFTGLNFLLIECQSHQEEKSKKPTLNNSDVALATNSTFPKKSIVYNSIVCDSNMQYSYSLYLPTSFDGLKKHPVAFAFDPHGDGALPLKNFQRLADKYNYILVGSNNCKNGMPWKSINAVAQATMKEVLLKYPVDNKRIYTVGFSGGARVASALAIENGMIAGVTAIGAGFQNSNANLTYNFDFFGMAGHGDFNMTELLSLDQMLSTTTMPHYVHLYNGKHEWSPEAEMNYAFLWHDFQAMRANKISKKDTLLNQFTKQETAFIAVARKQKNIMDEYNGLSRLVKFSEGLQDVTLYKQQLATLAASKTIVAMQRNRQQSQMVEEQLTKSYWKTLQEKNLEWWKNEIGKRNSKKNLPNTAAAQQNERLLGFLGLATYMQASDAVAKMEVEKAEKLLQIYQWLEPKNAEQPYLKAALNSSLGNKQKALDFLKEAIELGFSDTTRLYADAHFVALKSEEQFQEMLKKIRNK